MEITTQYILSQIITIFVYLFLASTYCVKNRKLVLAFSFASNFLNAVAFILLGAYTSSAMCGISIFRDIIFIIDEKINGKSDKITKKDVAILLLIYGISIISIAITFKGFSTLMYAVATMLYTFSIWQKNNKVYRFLGIPCTFLGICDAIIIKSIFGAILQGIVMITSIAGVISNSENKKLKYLNKIIKNDKEPQVVQH